MNIVKHDTAKVHALKDGRPLCGGGCGAKSVKWQNDFGPVNCERCLEIQENQRPMQTKMTEIDAAAKLYADAHEDLTNIITTLNSEIDAIKQAALKDIKRAVAKVAEREAAVVALIDDNRNLFVKPKSVVFHNVRVGLRKGSGGIDWADDAAVVANIRQHFPKMFSALVKVTEKPLAKALSNLEDDQLKQLGCTVEDSIDLPYVSRTDSEVDKIVDALLKGVAEATEEKEAA